MTKNLQTTASTLNTPPVLYTKDQHGIDPTKINKHALYVLEKLSSAGFEAYLVGGSVRDLLLGHKPKDFDVATSAKPEEVKKVFPRCFLIGRRFRLAHVRFGKLIIEVATFRAGNTAEDNLITHDNTWGSPEEDAKRRDFTINGLFYNAQDETILDFVKGVEDIKKEQIKVIGVPHLRFKQDPVRMIRLIKFEARFGLKIDPEAHTALLECRSEILKSSQARVFEEIFRMLESGAATPFFKGLAKYELLGSLFPMLSAFLEHDKGPLLYQYLEQVDLLTKERQKPLKRPLLLASLIFPLLETHLLNLHEQDRALPIGEIHKIATKMIYDFFHPFFLVPRRMRQIASYILVYQFRMTPLKTPLRKKIRIPQSEDFDASLYFFYMRACLDPKLATAYEKWVKAVYAFKEKRQTKWRS